MRFLLFAILMSFAKIVSAQNSLEKDPMNPYEIQASIRNSLEALLQEEIEFLGSRNGQRISIPELLQKLENIKFVSVPFIAKPMDANRFSAFSDPLTQTIFINAHDALMESLIRPISLHEFFMNVGVDDSEYQLSLLMDAFISLGSTASRQDLTAQTEKFVENKKLLKTLLLNAMNQYVRHSGGSSPYVSITEANSRIILPDGGSGVGNGGDNNDIFFKKKILDYFLDHLLQNESPIKLDTTAFIIDVVSIKVRLNFTDRLFPSKFLVTKNSNMLAIVNTSVLKTKFNFALHFAKQYVIDQWKHKNSSMNSSDSFAGDISAKRTMVFDERSKMHCRIPTAETVILDIFNREYGLNQNAEIRLIQEITLEYLETNSYYKEVCVGE